jgi:endonuclease/exonuclease/phosphatase family metal-dependent hydrolase
MRQLIAGSLVLGLLFGQPGATAADGGGPPDDAGPTLTAMSLNLFVGLDVGPIFAARDLQSFQAAAAAGWANVLATDFHARAEALAALIDETDPDVIGLQEAMLWKTGTLFDPAPAETVAYDFIAILISALADRGLAYDDVAVVENLDFEAPVVGASMDLRAIDRDALLVLRTPGQSRMRVGDAQEGRFAAALTFPFVAGALTQPRGWVSIDLQHRGQEIRVVNTHLEAFAAPVRDAQAAELLAGPLAGHGPAILIGDLNATSDGSDPGTYDLLIQAGFSDSWTQSNAGAAGFTCCQGPTLIGPSILSERIDYVLFRDAPETSVVAIGTSVVGEEADDRTTTGTWPSDHAGVVAHLRIKGVD